MRASTVLLVWSGALKIDVASALWHSTALEASKAWKAMRERFMGLVDVFSEK
jgi:hypothetical protein